MVSRGRLTQNSYGATNSGFGRLESSKSPVGPRAKISFAEISKGSGRMTARLTFSSKQMRARLIELGIKREPPPNMNLEMSRHFIRGLFDGDGSAYISNGLLRFNLVGEKFLCEWVISRFREFTGLNHRIGPYKKPNTVKVVSVQMAGHAAVGFGKMIYEAQTIDCLSRKKNLWCAHRCLLKG